jgi:capsular polysaccharide biosynthesis protein
MARFGQRSARRRRLYIKRAAARSIDQPAAVEAFLIRKDFEPVSLDHMPIEERIRLFQEADIVVGAHGAELANLLFSPPGTKVIELMPNDQFRPAVWSMANKLGHVHALLGCPTHDGSFDGRLIVDNRRLAAIHRMVTSYR